MKTDDQGPGTWVWHGHHANASPLEWLPEGIEARRAKILMTKPLEEHALRLRLLQPVHGPLPARLLNAKQAQEKAWRAWRREMNATEERMERVGQARDEADQALYAAQRACMRASASAATRRSRVVNSLRAPDFGTSPVAHLHLG